MNIEIVDGYKGRRISESTFYSEYRSSHNDGMYCDYINAY